MLISQNDEHVGVNMMMIWYMLTLVLTTVYNITGICLVGDDLFPHLPGEGC